jgi:hypothetical protein
VVSLNPRASRSALLLLLLSACTTANALTPWGGDTHQVAAGDFDGDGSTDVLFIADDPAKSSGIALSHAGVPNAPSHSWSGNYLGIPWHGRAYRPVVGDFNGDGRDDIFLQRESPGDHFLLLAKAGGNFTAIHQVIPERLGRQAWSGLEHRIVAGDFNGDGRCDLLLQAARPERLNAIFLAGARGTFTNASQTWADDYLGFRWSTRESIVEAGDFNGDGKADLLLQARPDFVLIEGDVQIPVPVYRPNSFGVLAASPDPGERRMFYKPALQIWDREVHGGDWSALYFESVVADFNRDGRADVFLRARDDGLVDTVYLAGRNGQFETISEPDARMTERVQLVPVSDGSLPASAQRPVAIAESAMRE